MFCVVVTGGVASGKSAVTGRFQAHGVRVIDADRIARAVLQPGAPALPAVVARFGSGVVLQDGSLDRAAMRRRVFADDAERRALEAIVHPYVHDALREGAATAPGPYVILAIPLLAETDSDYGWVDRVLCVDVEPATQITRLLARDGVDRALAERMVSAQATREARLAISDDVIVNEGTLADLDRAVATLHARYLALAARNAPAGA